MHVFDRPKFNVDYFPTPQTVHVYVWLANKSSSTAEIFNFDISIVGTNIITTTISYAMDLLLIGNTSYLNDSISAAYIIPNLVSDAADHLLITGLYDHSSIIIANAVASLNFNTVLLNSLKRVFSVM
ncbi:hypothetical protein FNV43_RR00300 [Rhamnella rubrinervis]|uniref:Uncharacterized protein n=1 Tax=Rhamnella rubrinervis TaxID=2594499 RepID=A0A8K0MS96_9ROSA|nr:hypothetical protein FNV43_RR00300 [Rhamnella rubrinervis]